MENETIVESNAPKALEITRKRSKPLSTKDYYLGTNLGSWSVQELIKARVDKESFVQNL